MRLFIAIDLPKDITDYLFFLQSFFPEHGLVKSFHLTLKFLGETELKDLPEKLMKIKSDAFELILDDLGAFPNKKHPRVIWVGIMQNPALDGLQKQIDLALPEFKPDFKFYPHLTLARCKDKSLFPRLDVEHRKFIVADFKLYSSLLTAQGPVYKEIKAFKLT